MYYIAWLTLDKRNECNREGFRYGEGRNAKREFRKGFRGALPVTCIRSGTDTGYSENTAWREARQTREYEFVWAENDVAGVQSRTLNHLRFRARDELDNFRYPLERSVECRRKPILESGTTQVKVGAMVRPGGQAADAEGGIPYPTQAYTLEDCVY